MPLNADETFTAFPNAPYKKLSLQDVHDESVHFKELQQRLVEQFEKSFPDKKAPKTVIIIPSLTMDTEILSKINGITHYEERLLCLLLLLRMPRTHVVYVTSMPVDPIIIDYYLHLLPGVTGYHANQRLSLLSCYDASSRPLTEKILERPRLIERIKKSIPEGHATHMACFNVTPLERTLAIQLDVPIYGCDPDLFELGNKTNSRKIFKECGLMVPDGFEDLHTEEDITKALYELKVKHPSLKKAVVKINDGFSGDGNGIFYYEGIEDQTEPQEWIKQQLSTELKIVAAELSYELFIFKFQHMGGIVELFVEGETKISPSVQCRISPTGDCDVVSTHDQELGGDSGQIFIGAHFPAHIDYAVEIGKMGKCVAENLRDRGVLGRFAIDFISVKEKDQWRHYAIEINLRKGGTTHPFIMLEFLTDGVYNAEDGIYHTATGQPRYYFSSDNLKSEKYIGTTPHDLIDIAMLHELHYDGALQEGVMFHLIGALSQFGKLGVVCVGSSRERVKMYYDRTVGILDLECYHDFIPQARI
jgi:hypothetical protein